jgi:hypothetical protein
MGDYQAMKTALEKLTIEDSVEVARDRSKALYDLANDLTYPVDDHGNQVNIHWLIPLLAQHLEKCGYRKHEDKAVIKQIPHPRRGHAQVAEDAVIYVPVDTHTGIPKVFISTPEEQPYDPVNDQWHTKTHITFNGETVKGEQQNGAC